MFERCIYFNSNALVRKINRIWDRAYAVEDISASHAYLLRMVNHQPGLTQKQIASELFLEKSTITRFVMALIERGLLKRKQGEDGRENLLYVTVAGRKLARRLDKVGAKLYRELRKQLGDRKFENMVTNMRHLHTLLG